ncbi:MAG: TetR/AcrR family transcriptional regulator [Anaerolineae bacterium]|nr:TetR/AcrR family transcriptional regulator [Anaerolineae bacterium]
MDDLIILSEQRPTRADAVRNRDHLLCVARRMFDAYGVDEVTMSAIAHEAKVGKGTLYRNFPDKLALCRELLDQEQRELQERTLQRLHGGGPPFDHLAWFMNEVLGFVWRNLGLLRGEGGVLPLAHPAHFWWRQTIRGLLQPMRPSLDIDYLADTLFVLLDPRVLAYQRTRGYGLDRIAAAMIDTARRLLDDAAER